MNTTTWVIIGVVLALIVIVSITRSRGKSKQLTQRIERYRSDIEQVSGNPVSFEEAKRLMKEQGML